MLTIIEYLHFACYLISMLDKKIKVQNFTQINSSCGINLFNEINLWHLINL